MFKFINWLQDMVAAVFCVILFLLPLKFGSIAGIPEVPALFSEHPLAWLIISWPATLFPMISGGLLAAAMLAFPLRIGDYIPSFRSALLWLMTAFAAIIGFINASVFDLAALQVVHIFGIAAFGMAAYFILSNRPDFRRWMLMAIFLGTVMTVFFSLEQYFSGFEDTEQFLAQNEAQYGVVVNGDIKAMMESRRVFGPFSSCNSLAGYLLLTGPLALSVLWGICRRIEPSRVSILLFMPPFAVALSAVFILTWSRAAFVALLLTGIIFIALQPVSRKVKIVLAVLLPATLLLAGLLLYLSVRSMFSSYARLDYLLASVKMFMAHPFAGTGWGDFFHDYMALKLIVSKEAPHSPHNIIFAFLGETGIFGFLAVTAALLYPLLKGLRLLRGPDGKFSFNFGSAMWFGLAAWLVQSMAEVSLQIPGMMAAAVVISVIMLSDTRECGGRFWPGEKLRMPVYLLATAAAAVALFGGLSQLRWEYAFSKLSDLCSVQNKDIVAYRQIDPESVKQLLQECNRIKPYSPTHWGAAADFMVGCGHPDIAESYYQEAIKRAPQRSFLYFRLYHLYKLQGRPMESYDNLRKARELFPHNPEYWEDTPMPGSGNK